MNKEQNKKRDYTSMQMCLFALFTLRKSKQIKHLKMSIILLRKTTTTTKP